MFPPAIDPLDGHSFRELIRDPDAAVEQFGGQRDATRLTSISDAVEYIEDNGGDVPFGLGKGSVPASCPRPGRQTHGSVVDEIQAFSRVMDE
jgi:hypothetical protein